MRRAAAVGRSRAPDLDRAARPGARLHAEPARGGSLPEDARGADRLHDDAARRPGGRADSCSARSRPAHRTTSSGWPRSRTRWCTSTRWAPGSARCRRWPDATRRRRPGGSATRRSASWPTRRSEAATAIIDSHRRQARRARGNAAGQRGPRARRHRPDHGRRPARRPDRGRRVGIGAAATARRRRRRDAGRGASSGRTRARAAPSVTSSPRCCPRSTTSASPSTTSTSARQAVPRRARDAAGPPRDGRRAGRRGGAAGRRRIPRRAARAARPPTPPSASSWPSAARGFTTSPTGCESVDDTLADARRTGHAADRRAAANRNPRLPGSLHPSFVSTGGVLTEIVQPAARPLRHARQRQATEGQHRIRRGPGAERSRRPAGARPSSARRSAARAGTS